MPSEISEKKSTRYVELQDYGQTVNVSSKSATQNENLRSPTEGAADDETNNETVANVMTHFTTIASNVDANEQIEISLEKSSATYSKQLKRYLSEPSLNECENYKTRSLPKMHT